MSANSSKP